MTLSLDPSSVLLPTPYDAQSSRAVAPGAATLLHWGVPDDPYGDAGWSAIRDALRAHSPRHATRRPDRGEAAVTLLLREAPDMELLLIQRVERAGDPWSGHMALPGGRRAPIDEDLLDTAFRETREEVGIQLRRDRDLLGRLDDVAPRSTRLPPLVVAPYVARTDARAELRPDPREVAAAVWIPLRALRDETAIGEVLVELEGGTRAFPAFRYESYEIWGLTHRILSQFMEVVVHER